MLSAGQVDRANCAKLHRPGYVPDIKLDKEQLKDPSKVAKAKDEYVKESRPKYDFGGPPKSPVCRADGLLKKEPKTAGEATKDSGVNECGEIVELKL